MIPRVTAAALALAAMMFAATSTATTATVTTTTSTAALQVEEGPNPWIIGGTSLAIVGVLAGWAKSAWWDQPTVPFHFKDTGYLNKDTYAGGSDKLGHTYVCYLFTIGVTHLYEALGMSHDAAAYVSAGAVLLVSNGVELADGITEYGFEYGDVIANTMGIGLGLAGELSPWVKSTFGLRIGYVPSRDFLANDKSFLKFINDYAGMLYYLDVKPKGIFEAFDEDPGAWRYVITGLVWSTDKYSPVRDDALRRRSFGVHVSLSLPEILRAAYPGDKGVEAYATFFDYYAVPFISLSVQNDLNTGQWYFSFGVANRSEISF